RSPPTSTPFPYPTLFRSAIGTAPYPRSSPGSVIFKSKFGLLATGKPALPRAGLSGATTRCAACAGREHTPDQWHWHHQPAAAPRSEERRVGKECRAGEGR